MNTYGSLYNYLISHTAVDQFTFELKRAYDSDGNPVLASMWNQLKHKQRPLTRKQIEYARKIIEKQNK